MKALTRSVAIRQVGLSLIELLVAMAIGLVVTLAASTVLLNFEGDKRKLTTANDMNQAAAFASYSLDRILRNAGSGFAVRGEQGAGCLINASRDGTAILPAPTALPAPFNGLDGEFRLAPILIYDGESSTGSDVLAIMSGSQGGSELPARAIDASISATSLRLPNTLAWRPNDLALIVQAGRSCLLQQLTSAQTPAINSAGNQTMEFGGAYSPTTGLTAFGGVGPGADVFVAPLGNVDQSRPDFRLLGVGDSNTLQSYDLLRLNGVAEAVQPVLDGVVEMHAVYGLDTNSNGDIDTWQSPSVSPWRAADLLSGTAAAALNLRQIAAVRIGLILRTSVPEKDAVAPTQLQLFGDVGLAYTKTLTADERLFRHRTVEFAVPLRNVLTTNFND
jgi:type IV pilus assembly protein PilW